MVDFLVLFQNFIGLHSARNSHTIIQFISKAYINPRGIIFFFLQILRVSRDSQFSPPSERTASDPLLETLEARETVDLVLDVMFR